MRKRIPALLLAAVMLIGTLSAPMSSFAAGGAENYPLNSIVIKVEDIVTHQMLGGARFEVYYNNSAVSGGYGTLLLTVDSDSSGVIVISGLPSGYYIVRQTMPPNNYQLSISNEQHAYIKPDGTSIVELVFSNYRYGGLLVLLTDKDTGEGVGGSKFSVTDVNGVTVGHTADGIYTTDARGEFYLENLPAGDYKITQLTAAQGYAMDSVPNVRTVRLQHTSADNSMFMVEFQNSPLGTLLVRLKDSVSKAPIQGAVFSVRLSGGADLGEFVTNADGSFSLPRIARGTYIISQVSATAGYLTASGSKTQYVDYISTYAVDFENQPRSGLYVTKYDKDTKMPLKDAKFYVYQGSTLLGSYTTGADGVFHIPNLDPGWYTVTEHQAPYGYILDETPKSVQVTAETMHRLEFENSRISSLQIIKTDEFTGEPLSGARFRVTTQNGEFVGDISTDASGKATIPSVEPGWYVISETRAPVGYLITEAAKTVEVKATVPTVVTVTNRAENNLQIVKLDFFTRAPLAGATFKVEQANGANVGTFLTDSAGKILVGNLKEGAYVISELKAPDGYLLDAIPQTIVIEGGKLHSVEFLNKPLSGIQIIKTDAVTHQPLSDATFTVERSNGERIGTFKTDAAGKAIVPDLESGTYIVSETIAPEGYILSGSPKMAVVASGKLTTVEFANQPKSGIQILKTDANTNAPLQGAVFTVQCVNGERVGDKYTTDVAGKIIVSDLIPGVYIISEIQAPAEYILDAQPQTVEVKSGRLTIAEFVNKPFPYLYIQKTDAATGNLVAGAKFTVTNQNGEIIANVTSIASGPVSLKVAPGVYTVTEVQAPEGYELNDPVRSVEVKADGSTVYSAGGGAVPGNTVSFANRPLNTIEIVKLDAVTHNPLSGAMFTVDKADGTRIGSYRTDSSGKILVTGITEGTYVISETAAPSGYILNEAPKSINVSGGRLVSVEFLNKPLSGIQIIKLDSITRNPLPGASFTVTKANGERVGTFRTEADGKVLIPGLDEGVYVVGEIAAPDGYVIDETPKNVTVVSGRLATVEFLNKPLSGIQILKLDAVTKAPLMGATFTVERSNGEKIGTYKTDSAGKIIVPGLTEGTYIVSETDAPDGYILDEAPKTVTVTSGKLTDVEFTNKPLAGLQIKKIDSNTRQPIAGVSFAVSKMNGERVGEFVTGSDGLIFLPGLESGWYTVVETKATDGYVIDSQPRNVEVKWGAPVTLTVENTAMAGLLIVKTDAANGKPLAGVVFEVRRADGQVVTSAIADGNQPNTVANSPNRTAEGGYITDANGRILINTLPAGEYHVIEKKALDGYELDTTVHPATVIPGRLTTIQVTNTPMAGLRILKIDSVTKQPIFGVEFMLFDSNNVVVGTYRTDNNGVIDFTGIIPEGRYTIRETRAANGYYLDDMPRTVEFVKGRVTEIRWENTPQMGQIQITKKSGDDNQVNGLLAGTPLSGAVFEVYNHRTGNLIDRFVSGTDGRAVSKPLPLGRYTVKEVQAPQWYRISDQVLDIEIEFATQIIKHDFLNYSANTGVSIRKTGNNEAMSGDVIPYTIREIRNTSTVPLTDFYWRDTLPVDAVRLTKITTGTYNQALQYKIIATTNKGDTRVIADNLSTTRNNVIDCSNASLGLRNDEFITSVTFVFGTVKAGFAEVEKPQIFVKVQPNLPNGYQFANKCDIGGKYGSEWVVGNSTWLTTIYALPGKLPRTGY